MSDASTSKKGDHAVLLKWLKARGIRARNISLYDEARTHFSAGKSFNYEKLEYLGDILFGAAVGSYLYARYSDHDEGFLTTVRAKIVRTDFLAKLAINLHIQDLLVVSKKFNMLSYTLIEDAFEGIIGAMVIDMGVYETYNWIVDVLERMVDWADIVALNTNYKYVLLKTGSHYEWKSSRCGKRIEVELINTITGQTLARSRAIKRIDAEQLSAKIALEKMGIENTTELRPSKRPRYEEYNPSNIELDKATLDGILGFESGDLELYQTAFRHSSMSHSKESYERLEYLGDSWLDTACSIYLYSRYGEEDASFLTGLHSRVVCTATLSKISSELGIGRLVWMSRSVEEEGGRSNSSILEDCFEALVGAIYIEEGVGAVQKWVNHIFDHYVDWVDILTNDTNYKHQILTYFQSYSRYQPEWRLEGYNSEGQIVIALLDERGYIVARGTGKERPEAEQMASRKALQALGRIPG